MTSDPSGEFSVAERLERLPLTSYQRKLFTIIATAWFFDSMDLGMLTYVLGSIRTEFHLSAPRAGALGSMSFVGMFFGAALAGMLADRFGRRIVFQGSMIIWGVGSLLCAYAANMRQLMLYRAVLGLGMGMEFPIGQSLVSEFIPARQRGRYIAVLEGFWPIGFIAAGFLAYLLLPLGGWRLVFVAEAVPALFVLAIRLFVPESPRWLEARGRADEAHRVLSAFEDRVRRARGGAELPTPIKLAASAVTGRGRFSFLELFAPGYVQRTIMVWALWFFALVGYYGLTTWLGALLQEAGYTVTRSTLYITLISLAGVPGFAAAAWLIERWGRKAMMIVTLLGSAVTAYFYGTATGFAQLVGFGLCMQFFMFAMWSVLYAYTPELYPTHARATGAGCASSVGRVGALLGPTIVGLIKPISGQAGVFTLGAGAFVIAALVVLALGIETRGKTLEELNPLVA
jgi:putative MFS transporter